MHILECDGWIRVVVNSLVYLFSRTLDDLTVIIELLGNSFLHQLVNIWLISCAGAVINKFIHVLRTGLEPVSLVRQTNMLTHIPTEVKSSPTTGLKHSSSRDSYRARTGDLIRDRDAR